MRIPVYKPDRRDTIPGGNAGFPHATADAFGAQVGQATAKLGQTIASTLQSISSDAEKYQKEADTTTANLALSEAETTLTTDFYKARNETSPDQIAGFAQRTREQADAVTQENLAKIPASQQQRATVHLRKFSNNIYENAYLHEQKQSEAHWSSKIDEHVGGLAAQVQKAPEDLAGARIRLEEIIAGAPIPDWKKRDMLGAKLPMLVEGAMQGYRDKLKPLNPEDRPIGRQRDDIILQMQNLHKAVDSWGVDHDTRSRSDAESVVKHARGLGISPRDYAAVMSYETGGSFDPNKRGGMNRDGSGKGSFLGLIQMSPENQRRYGVKPGMTFDEQMVANSAYLKDRGLQPGHGLAEIYSIINAGSLDKSGQPRWDRSDANGNMRTHVGKIAADHYSRADKFLGEVQMADAGGSGEGRVQIAQAGGDVSGIKMGAQKRQQFSNHLRSIIENAVNESKLGDREEAAALTSAINDDQAQILATGKQSPLNRARVERSQGPAYAESWQAQRDASTDYYNRTLGLAELSPLEAEQRVESLRPLEGPEFPYRQKLYQAAGKQLDALDKLRTTDPAAFADNTRAIKEFRLTMKPGNVADTESLIAARMDTQRMLGVPEPLIAPITNEEAKGLGLRVIDKLGAIDPKQRAVVLREFAQGLEQTYGAKYAYPVLTYAVQHIGRTEKETAEEISKIVREVQIGEHEPGKLVADRKRAAAEAETALKSLQGDFSLPWTTKGGAVLDPPRIDLTGADGNPMSVKFRDLQWLVTSPANAQPGFDATYGEGAAWAVINNLRTYGSTTDPVAGSEWKGAVQGPAVSRPGGRASFEGQNVPTTPAPIAPATPAPPAPPLAGQRTYAPDDVRRLAADPENQRSQFEQQYGPGSADEALQIFNSRPGRQKRSEGGDALEGLALQMAMFSEGSEDKINQLLQHTTASREFLRDENTGALTGMRVAGKEYGVKRDKNNRLTGMTVKET